MSRPLTSVLVSHDAGLLEHWQRAFRPVDQVSTGRFEDFCQLNLAQDAMAWVDLSLPDVPPWGDERWLHLVQKQKVRVVAASSNPKDREAIEALDAGCAAYCHAFSDAETLLQVTQVVQAGHVWIGKTLMQRLIQSAGRIAAPIPELLADWGESLTHREREVALLAANGASNRDIATDCRISERTVKAHLSAVFNKINITDRLQLALRVHGIH